MNAIQWTPHLIAKYNINGPRYTSYPTALAMHESFDRQQILKTLDDGPTELSLYLHIPFCHKLCYYCGCNKVVTRHQTKADAYLQGLAQEMSLYSPMLKQKNINQLHLGGGTPTFLTEEQLSQLMAMVNKYFNLVDEAEISIEIDPRSCSDEKLVHLRQLGFNRVSYGIQDVDEKVQIAINRVQDTDLIRHQVKLSQSLGFESINLDLIYGLPFQNLDSFAKSIEEVIKLDPDRISLFSYAHLPERFASQRKLERSSLPNPEQKLGLQTLAINAFVNAGYQFIGMDHFAKPNDALAKAQTNGKLQRNFQGYTISGQDALVGLGVSSISQVNGVLWQNGKSLNDYYTALKRVDIPVERGFCLTDEDKLRGAIITQLICHFELDIGRFSQKWQIDDFWQYFADALRLLQPFINDELIAVTEQHIIVSAKGRLWVRSICACFDAYLKHGSQQYSKVV